MIRKPRRQIQAMTKKIKTAPFRNVADFRQNLVIHVSVATGASRVLVGIVSAGEAIVTAGAANTSVNAGAAMEIAGAAKVEAGAPIVNAGAAMVVIAGAARVKRSQDPARASDATVAAIGCC